MMIACDAVAEEERDDGGARQQDEHGVAQLTPQHRERIDVMGSNGIGAVARQSRGHLRAGQSLSGAVEPAHDLINRGRSHPLGGQRVGARRLGTFGVIDIAGLPVIG